MIMEVYMQTSSSPIKISWNVLLIAVGSILCAVAINGILIPKQFLAGGITGLALLLHYLLTVLPIGLIYFLLNIPLFVIGWLFVGRRFFLYSLAGMAIFSAAMFLPVPVFPVDDQILNALTAGIITGFGSGVILRSLGSAGGLDILGVILLKKFSLRLGTTVLVFNCLLMLAAVFRIPLSMVLYTLVYMYVSSHVVNVVVTGFNQRKAVMIVSPHWREIAGEIMARLNRGITVVDGEGGYTGQPQRIIYSVITFSELSRFKEMVRQIDPNAFVVVTETLEVMGRGIGNQPHW
jgi:uncharacterized membrane-anchored protein YitT (DUF2179 family)